MRTKKKNPRTSRRIVFENVNTLVLLTLAVTIGPFKTIILAVLWCHIVPEWSCRWFLWSSIASRNYGSMPFQNNNTCSLMVPHSEWSCRWFLWSSIGSRNYGSINYDLGGVPDGGWKTIEDPDLRWKKSFLLCRTGGATATQPVYAPRLPKKCRSEILLEIDRALVI